MFEFISSQRERLTGSRFAKASMLVLLVVATAILANAKSRVVPPPQNDPVEPIVQTEQPRIEVVFALDTTGSMSGLINGAKQKIWSIVNQMASANTTPEIRIGLIGYRDRGDQYVTKRFDLTDDIDTLYGNLQNFSADGGGDTPESVNQALDEAVTQMSWSRSQDVYKVIFLVGDAPPHMDYQDDVAYTTSVKGANRRGIVINTIQCGGRSETATVFASIAKLAQGRFASISQDGAMVATHTPMDEELTALNRALAGTIVAYGAESEKSELRDKMSRSLAAEPAAAASRLSYFAKQGGVANSGRGDLIDALSDDEVDLDDLTEEELPSEMMSMSAPERTTYLRQKTLQRDEIKSKIATLVESRDAYLKEESSKRAAKGRSSAFDDNLLETLRSQAAKKGIVY